MEVLDENEWLPKMEQLKRGGKQEMIIKCNYSRVHQQTLSDMAYQLGLYLFWLSLERGCGKTTQLPQFILEEEISSLRGADCSIICTQPRRISAISVASQISFERGETLAETVSYQIRLETKRSEQTRLLCCTTGVFLRRLAQEPDLIVVSHLLIDEIHERGMNEDFLLIIVRDLPRRPDLRVILMSSIINRDLFSQYFANAPTIHIPGFTYPVEEFFLEDVLEKTRYSPSESDGFQVNSRRKRQQDSEKDPLTEVFEDVDVDRHYGKYRSTTRQSLEAWSGSELHLGLVEATIEYICRNEGDGAILVFLTGWDDIAKLHDKQQILQRAASLLTMLFLCGKQYLLTSYDALNKLACLLRSWISKASAHQRRGRAGWVQPGVCYRLYPKIIHDAMPQYQLPEILRRPLQELCLQVKSLQLGEIGLFLSKALQPPDSLAVQNAIELLKTIGALDDREQLTPLGRHLCTLPVDPNIWKMLLMGSVFQCLYPALTIVAALAHRDPFVLPINRKEEADAAKSDHIFLLKAFEGWKDAKRNGNGKSFCWENSTSESL